MSFLARAVNRIFLLLSFVFFLNSAPASARVFNFIDQSFSTYLRGSYGTSQLQRNGYAPGYPSTVSFSNSSPVTLGYSGEFGFAFTSSKAMNVRLGLELLYPSSTTGASGNNSAGTSLFSMDEQIYSVIPQMNAEMFLKKGVNSRLYLGLGAGYAITTIKNTFTMTTAGNSAFGITNYIEEESGWGIMGQAYLGYEFGAFDNVTFCFDAGYRLLTVSNFTANRDFKSPAGQFYSGNPVKNVDGTNRFVDLSGFFGAFDFRFYFH